MSSRSLSLEFPIPDIGEVPCNRRRRRHHGTHQMRSPTASLSPFEIAVAGGSAALARLQNVRIHSQTHGASRFTPLKPCVQKNTVQSLLLGRALYRLRSRHNHGTHIRTYLMTFGHARCRPQIFETRVRARPNKDTVDADVLNALPRFQPHVL